MGVFSCSCSVCSNLVLKGPIISTLLITGKSLLQLLVTSQQQLNSPAGDGYSVLSHIAAVGTYMTLGIMGGIINAIQGITNFICE